MIDITKVDRSVPKSKTAPTTFPRSNWCRVMFGCPEFRIPYDRPIQIVSAAYNAGEAIRRGEHVDSNGYILAVATKATEMMDYERMERIRGGVQLKTMDEWREHRDRVASQAIDLASTAIKAFPNVEVVSPTNPRLRTAVIGALDYDYEPRDDGPELFPMTDVVFDESVLQGYEEPAEEWVELENPAFSFWAPEAAEMIARLRGRYEAAQSGERRVTFGVDDEYAYFDTFSSSETDMSQDSSCENDHCEHCADSRPVEFNSG